MINQSAAFRAKATARQSTPIELIDVYLGAQNAVDDTTLFFNDSNGNMEFWPYRDLTQKQSYIALGMKRSGVQQHMGGQIDSVDVVLDNVSRTFSTLFTQYDLRGKRIVIRRVYADLLQASGDYELLFDGIIDTPDMSLEDGMRIELKPSVQDSLNYKFPKEYFQVSCNNRFTNEYCANSCGPKTSAQLLQERTGKAINSITSQTQFKCTDLASEASGDYDPAIIKITAGNASNVDQRRTCRVSGDTVRLDHPFPADIEVGNEFSIQRDCAKEFERDCRDRFENQDNFRGFKTTPKTMIQRAVVIVLPCLLMWGAMC